jgi:hypothetical protein
VGGTIANIRIQGVRVLQPLYSCVHVPAPYAPIATLHSTIDSSQTTMAVDESTSYILPTLPFVVQVESEQMNVTARTAGSPTTYTVTRGYGGTAASAHATLGVNVDYIGTATVSDLLFDGCDFVAGGVDTSAVEMQVNGINNVALRNCVFGPQSNAATLGMAEFGSGGALGNRVLNLVVENCRFEGIGSGVTGIVANNVRRVVIEKNVFDMGASSAQAIQLAAATTGAVILDNNLSTSIATTPIVDSTGAADTISRHNSGYTDRRVTRAVTSAQTVAATDDIIWAGGAGGFTITLPPSSGARGKAVTIKNVSGGAVTIGGSGSDVIDGSTTYSLATANKYVTLVSDGTSKWYVVANN